MCDNCNYITYDYDNYSCSYDCMMSEYIYWALTSILGAQEVPGNDSKGFAKAEKTKLGKSIESEPADASSVVAKKSNSDEGWFVITEAKTPFYAIGPGQPLPPEKTLDRGSMLTVTKGGWGWSNVKLGTGELGVVSCLATVWELEKARAVLDFPADRHLHVELGPGLLNGATAIAQANSGSSTLSTRKSGLFMF